MPVLTRAVEYLLTISRPGGGRLVGHEHTQILVPIFPAATTLSWSAAPADEDYAQIAASIKLGAQMVPGAFTAYLQISGTKNIQGTLGVSALECEWSGFIWVTRSAPILYYVTNISGLAQEFEVNYATLRISSEEDFKTVCKELDHMATSTRSEELQAEAVALLKAMEGGV